MLCSFINKTPGTLLLRISHREYRCMAEQCVKVDVIENDSVYIEYEQRTPLTLTRKYETESKPFNLVQNCHGHLSLGFKLTTIQSDCSVTISNVTLPIWKSFHLLKGHFYSFDILVQNGTAEQTAYFLPEETDRKVILKAHIFPFISMIVTAILMVVVSIIALLFGNTKTIDARPGGLVLLLMAIYLIKTEIYNWCVFVKRLKENGTFQYTK